MRSERISQLRDKQMELVQQAKLELPKTKTAVSMAKR